MKESYDTIEEFVKDINKLRRSKKNQWYQFVGTVTNKYVNVKAFNTSIQIFRVNGLSAGGVMDISVKDFSSILSSTIIRVPSKY